MKTYNVEVSIDKQECAQCHKMKKGCYRRQGGVYICQECVIQNIKIRGRSKLPHEESPS